MTSTDRRRAHTRGVVPTVLIWHVAGPVEDEFVDGDVVPSVRCLHCDCLVWIGERADAPTLGLRVELPKSCPGTLHGHDGL